MTQSLGLGELDTDGGLVAVRCASPMASCLPVTREQPNKVDESPHLRLGHVGNCVGTGTRHTGYV